jgi:DNA-directed RNA polymerase subunit RPC12/RpoP
MSANVRTECMDCGALIDTAADTRDSPVPCPNCCGTKRTVHLQGSATAMQPSNYLLDNFVAHKLSMLTECGAREIPTFMFGS